MPPPPPEQPPSAWLRPEEGQDRAMGPLQGTAEVARRSPLTSPLRTASPTPVRSARKSPGTNERSPPACVGGRSMESDISCDKSRRKRSGSRPINHGCSVRDSRPGSSSPTLRQLRSPFGGPWPTPRVAPGSSLLDVHRTLRPTLHGGKTRVVPFRQRRWSVAREHHAGTLVPEHRCTIAVRSRDACKAAVAGGNPACSTGVKGAGRRAIRAPLKVPAGARAEPAQLGWPVARRRVPRRDDGNGSVGLSADAVRTITARSSSKRRIAVRLVSRRSGSRCAR